MSRRRLAALLAVLAATAVIPARAETVVVTVVNMAFSPAKISAKVGDTVEWVNKDPFVHTATVKGGFDLPLPVKASGRIVLDKAGSFAYFCRYHPNMKGQITVAK